MARSQFRRSLRFENLEARQLLSSGGPTDQEQYMLQLINEARTDPAAVAAQITSPTSRRRAGHAQVLQRQFAAGQQTIGIATPQPPLAWNQDLANAAQGQSQYKADNQIQTHTGAGRVDDPAADRGGRLHQPHVQRREHLRLRVVGHGGDAGVPDGLGRSQRRPPHQYPAARRVGSKCLYETWASASCKPARATRRSARWSLPRISVARPIPRPRSWVSPTTTTPARASISPVKGRAAFRSTPSTSRPAHVSSTQTWDSGGYELSLAPGQYRIIASLNDTVIQTTNVTVSNLNIEQDFVLTNTWQGGTREAAIAAAQPVAAQPVAAAPATPQPITIQPITPATVTPVTISTPSRHTQLGACTHGQLVGLECQRELIVSGQAKSAGIQTRASSSS